MTHYFASLWTYLECEQFVGSASARSHKIRVVGNNWFVGWLVTETTQIIFLIFCIRLGDYKGRATEPDFWKQFLIWRYLQKSLKLAQNQTHWYFSKKGSNDFLGFWPEVNTKCDLQCEWNLYFRKICNFEIFGLEIIKKLPKLRFLAIFSTLHHYFAQNDRYAWCLVVFLQFTSPVNVFFLLLRGLSIWQTELHTSTRALNIEV